MNSAEGPTTVERLTPDDAKRLEMLLDTIERTDSGQDTERLLAEVLKPLLNSEGYSVVDYTTPGRDHGLDFKATRRQEAGNAEVLGVEWKSHTRPVNTELVRRLIQSALRGNVDRAILLSKGGFTNAARQEIERTLPIAIELRGLDDLRSWIKSAVEVATDIEAEIQKGIREFSERFARLIAKDAGALRHLEWRDIERVMAEVFEGLGFTVTLTPPAKDGGKDIVLEFVVAGKKVTYYVEVKHWRSATKVGSGAIQDLFKVVAGENRDGGLFLSTHGYTGNAFEQLTTVEKQLLSFGEGTKVVALCKTYVKAKAGLWSAPSNLTEVIQSDKIAV